MPGDHQERSQGGETPPETLQPTLEERRRYARWMSAQRRQAPKACLVCGTLMEAAYGKRLYCSGACRAKAYRQRHAMPPPR